jgi:hypothetical protein
MSEIAVLTADSGDFARLAHERVMLELDKDGDSPNCPRSWTWDMWFDGNYIEGNCEETSLHGCVKDAITSIDAIIGEMRAMRDFLAAYEVFGKEPEVQR